MVILILLAILWMPYVVRMLLRAQHARTPSSVPPQRAHVQPPLGAATDTAAQHAAWSALDDRQLTRLLTNSAPRTTKE